MTDDNRSPTPDADALRRHWATLDLGSSATVDEINAAFRRLSKTAHPDSATGSRERFDELQDARRALIDVLEQSRQPRVYLRTAVRRSPPASAAPRITGSREKPVWLVGAFAALTIGSITGIVGLIQLDRRIILVGLIAGVATGLLVTVVLMLRNVHSANTTPDAMYPRAEDVVRMRQPRDRRSSERRAG